MHVCKCVYAYMYADLLEACMCACMGECMCIFILPTPSQAGLSLQAVAFSPGCSFLTPSASRGGWSLVSARSAGERSLVSLVFQKQPSTLFRVSSLVFLRDLELELVHEREREREQASERASERVRARERERK